MAKNKRRNHKLRMLPVFLTTALLLMLAHIAEGREKLKIYVENDAAPWSKADGTGYANDLEKAPAAANMTMRPAPVPCLSLRW